MGWSHSKALIMPFMSFQGIGLGPSSKLRTLGSKYQPSLQSWLPLTWTLASFPLFSSPWTLLRCILVPGAVTAGCLRSLLPTSTLSPARTSVRFLLRSVPSSPELLILYTGHCVVQSTAALQAGLQRQHRRHTQDLFLPQSFMLVLAHGIHLLWPFYWFCFLYYCGVRIQPNIIPLSYTLLTERLVFYRSCWRPTSLTTGTRVYFSRENFCPPCHLLQGY